MEPIKCRQCETEFTPSRKGRPFCSRGCYYESLKGKTRSENVDHRTKTVKGHPIAPPCGVVAVARINLYEKIGPGPHPCHWCGKPVDWKPGSPYMEGNLIADHLDWDTTNDSPDNLVPSCNPCNGHRRKNGHSSPLQPGELTVIRGGNPTRAAERICMRCGAAFLVAKADLTRGRGRYCSKDCMYRRGQPVEQQP